MNQTTVQKKIYLSLAAISIVMLLSAAVVVPTLAAYADKGNDKPRKDNSSASPTAQDGDHKKGPKDPDNDGDKDNNGKHKGCEKGKHKGNDKYKKECDDNDDFK